MLWQLQQGRCHTRKLARHYIGEQFRMKFRNVEYYSNEEIADLLSYHSVMIHLDKEEEKVKMIW